MGKDVSKGKYKSTKINTNFTDDDAFIVVNIDIYPPGIFPSESFFSSYIFRWDRFVPWHISLILLCPLVYLLVAVIFYNISSRVSKKAHSPTCEKKPDRTSNETFFNRRILCSLYSILTFAVVRMCHNSEVSGQTVHIDTSAAMATENKTRTPLCSCQATITQSKFYNMFINGGVHHCGTLVKANSSEQLKTSAEDCSSSMFTLLRTGEKTLDVDISLMKLAPPYISNYCIDLKLGK